MYRRAQPSTGATARATKSAAMNGTETTAVARSAHAVRISAITATSQIRSRTEPPGERCLGFDGSGVLRRFGDLSRHHGMQPLAARPTSDGPNRRLTRQPASASSGQKDSCQPVIRTASASHFRNCRVQCRLRQKNRRRRSSLAKKRNANGRGRSGPPAAFDSREGRRRLSAGRGHHVAAATKAVAATRTVFRNRNRATTQIAHDTESAGRNIPAVVVMAPNRSRPRRSLRLAIPW